MNIPTPDQLLLNVNWSNLAQFRELPEIDFNRLHAYRLDRIKTCLRDANAAMCLLVNPISLRYALDYRTYGLFQSHIPTVYAFVPADGPAVLCGGYGPVPDVDLRPARKISFFEGGHELDEHARLLADDVVSYLSEIGSDNRRIAAEYINPSLTQALMQRGIEVIDGVRISEQARVIKSKDELECMRWACAVAELGISKLKQAIQPGVTEAQLWGLLNYTNLANNGDWHDGRMLASGDRINPWLQEASTRQVQSGDLVGFDTDMIGPNGYFADISRTMHCGPDKPTKRQKELYQLAHAEVKHNLNLIRSGITFFELQDQALQMPQEFHQNAYPCILHGVGMCDEYPNIVPLHRGRNVYDGKIETGMVLCIESYVGKVGERDGVKLEQQVVVNDNGYELMSTYPFEDQLLD